MSTKRVAKMQNANKSAAKGTPRSARASAGATTKSGKAARNGR